MSLVEMDRVTLAELAGGQAIEQFDHELAKVLENILDPNTEATKAREVVLKVSLKPDKNRTAAEVTISCTSKLTPELSIDTIFYLGRKNGVVQATEYNPKQPRLYDENVTPIKKEGNKE